MMLHIEPLSLSAWQTFYVVLGTAGATLTKKWREVPCRLRMGMKRHVAGRDTVLPSCREKQSMLE